MAFDDKRSVRPVFDDPLARFYGEQPAPQSGVKNPTTGIRETNDTAHHKKLQEDETIRKSEVRKRAIVYLMQNDIFREWLYDLLHTCNVFGTPFTTDPVMTGYNSGALFIGRLIEDDIKRFSIDEYTIMLREAWDRQQTWENIAADKK